MAAVRPAGVPEDAVCIPPSKVTQTEYIMSVQKQVLHQNTEAIKRYSGALNDWAANARISADLGLPIPTMPRAPEREVLHIQYATASGQPVTPEEGADEDDYAWLWHTSDGVWYPERAAAA